MGTEPVHVRCFSHVAITVADIDRSLDFYRRVLGFQLLAMRGPGGARNTLIHQRAAEVVGAGIQANRRPVCAHLHP